MGTFVISEDLSGAYAFRLYGDQGEILLVSEPYAARGGCLNGAEAALYSAQDEARYKRRISPEGAHYFLLTARNGKAICVSEHYESAAACEAGIAAVMRAAQGAGVYERLL
ncbi:DUF1508 domain-containing protein [Chitinophaga pollutisoli]|uniref:DUF1508 domain-containing protein n=1 Tax=Chitinophaga pollutisoli TaxID=3133966 RepID=A0ABZ2YSV8_9BACT